MSFENYIKNIEFEIKSVRSKNVILCQVETRILIYNSSDIVASPIL